MLKFVGANKNTECRNCWIIAWTLLQFYLWPLIFFIECIFNLLMSWIFLKLCKSFPMFVISITLLQQLFMLVTDSYTYLEVKTFKFNSYAPNDVHHYSDHIWQNVKFPVPVRLHFGSINWNSTLFHHVLWYLRTLYKILKYSNTF